MTLQKLLIKNLGYDTEQRSLFMNLNISINAGEVLQIYGANGTGKSTLLRILASYIEPLEGLILWENKCIFEDRDFYLQQINYVGHQNGLKPYLTVMENIKLQSALRTKKITEQEINLLLKRFSLDHLAHTLTFKLSAGQLKKLALTRLLVYPAKCWLLDEPTTSLDIQGILLLTEMIENHLKNGGLAIIATHQSLALEGKSLILGEQHAAVSH